MAARDDYRNQNNGQMLLWVKLWAPPERTWRPNSKDLRMNFIWRQSLYRGNQSERRSFVVVIQLLSHV